MALSLTIPAGTILKESMFDEIAPDGNPLHFRDRAATYIDPITRTDTGLQTRVVIANLVAEHDWPLTGIFLSTAGNQAAPHMAVHVDDFPSQTGAPDGRADKLQETLLLAMEFLYKNEILVDDEEDPDDGQTIDVSQFFPQIHVWNYPALIPRAAPGVGDYQVKTFANSPPGNWWQRL